MSNRRNRNHKMSWFLSININYKEIAQFRALLRFVLDTWLLIVLVVLNSNATDTRGSRSMDA